MAATIREAKEGRGEPGVFWADLTLEDTASSGSSPWWGSEPDSGIEMPAMELAGIASRRGRQRTKKRIMLEEALRSQSNGTLSECSARFIETAAQYGLVDRVLDALKV